ncbi:MAG: hypothetical protein MJZ68_09040 [archaeon]|nr:hypothetical protein [archaeon]
MSVKILSVDNLPVAVKSTVGDNALILDMSFGANKNFGDGIVTVTAAYEKPTGVSDDAIVMYQ